MAYRGESSGSTDKLAKWQRDNSKEDGNTKSEVEMDYSELETYPAAPVTMAFFP